MRAQDFIKQKFPVSDDRVTFPHQCSRLEIYELMEEFSDLNERSKWNEACEAQKQVCADEYVKSQLNCTTDSFRTILNAPKPEFKP